MNNRIKNFDWKDLSGKTVMQTSCTEYAAQLDIASLVSGSYMIRVSGPDNRTSTTSRFIKY